MIQPPKRITGRARYFWFAVSESTSTCTAEPWCIEFCAKLLAHIEQLVGRGRPNEIDKLADLFRDAARICALDDESAIEILAGIAPVE